MIRYSRQTPKPVLPEWRVLVARRKCDREGCDDRAEFYKRTEPGWTFYCCGSHKENPCE